MKRTYQNAHKWMLAMVLVCTLITGLIIPAQAYSAWNYHMKGSWQYEYYYVDGREDGYGERSDDAVKAWNDAVDARTNWTSLKPSLDIRLSETNNGSARTTRVVISPLDRGPDGYAGFTYYYDVDGRGTLLIMVGIQTKTTNLALLLLTVIIQTITAMYVSKMLLCTKWGIFLD